MPDDMNYANNSSYIHQQHDDINSRATAMTMTMMLRKDDDATKIKVISDDDAEIRRRAEALLSRMD